MVAECLWRPKSGCEHSELLGGDSDSGSLLLVRIFMSEACRLLFIAGEDAQLMVVTIFKQKKR